MTKFEAMGLLFVAPGRERKQVSVETKEVEEVTVESIQGKCTVACRMMDLHEVRCTKLSVKCCSSTHTKSNIIKNFNVTILLLENISL